MNENIKVIIYGLNEITNDFLYLFDNLKIYVILYDKEECVEELSMERVNISKQCFDDYDVKSISKDYIIIICGLDYLDKAKRLMSFGKSEGNDFIYAHKICKFLGEKDLDSLLERVFYGKRIYNQLQCAVPFRMISVSFDRLHTCCGGRVAISFTKTFSQTLEEIWFSLKRKIMCLSVLNGTYVFCNQRYCPLLHSYDDTNSKQAYIYYTQDISGYDYYAYPDILQLEYDAVCNLACPSCRTKHVCESRKKTEYITNYVLNGIVPYITHIRCAGYGEALYSKSYKRIIFSRETRDKELYLLSNGLLLDDKKLNDLFCHYKKVFFDISVDAGSEDVYKMIRGGDYELLMKNLIKISSLRLSGKVSKFVLNYTVSKKNISDLNNFIEMAGSLHVDSVRVSAIHNWGNMSREEFNEISILDTDFRLKKELYKYFKNLDYDIVKILDNNIGFSDMI